ncbi:MAG: PilZ domain-containing protein [Myxococcota bacterium]
MKEHRRAQRHKVRFKMVFDDGQTYSAGYVRDISRTGIFLETANPLPVGSEVRLEPVEHEGALFEVAAKVVRTTQATASMPETEGLTSDVQMGMGLEFFELGPKAGDGIEHLVRTLEAAQQQQVTGNLDPFLGVYVEDAPVGGDVVEPSPSPSSPPSKDATDLEEALDAAVDQDLRLDQL